MNRWLGRLHLGTATAVLVSANVVAAVALHTLLAALGAYRAGPAELAGVALAGESGERLMMR